MSSHPQRLTASCCRSHRCSLHIVAQTPHNLKWCADDTIAHISSFLHSIITACGISDQILCHLLAGGTLQSPRCERQNGSEACTLSQRALLFHLVFPVVVFPTTPSFISCSFQLLFIIRSPLSAKGPLDLYWVGPSAHFSRQSL